MRVPGTPARTRSRPGEIRVVTLNVWGWYFPTGKGTGKVRPGDDPSDAWRQRQEALRGGLSALRPDLVAFQEVIATDRYDQVADPLAARGSSMR